MKQGRSLSSIKIVSSNKKLEKRREIESNNQSSSIISPDNNDNKRAESQVKANSKCSKIDGKTTWLNYQISAQALKEKPRVDVSCGNVKVNAAKVVNKIQVQDNYCLREQSQKVNTKVRRKFQVENCSRRQPVANNKQTRSTTNLTNGDETKFYDSNDNKKNHYNVENDDDDDFEKDVDCGYAWIILAVMFVINASTFGTARAYGLIFEKLAREHNNARTEAALPFTIMGAIENMGGPLTGYLLTKTNSWRLTVFIGSCLITLAHLLAAFCTTLNSLILTMGLMCGLGLSFVTISSFQINNAYFVRYRSRAFGLGLTGAVFGTFYISPICQYILNNSSTTSECYLMLGLILLPNVPLSLLLKPKKTSRKLADSIDSDNKINQQNIPTISAKVKVIEEEKQQHKQKRQISVMAKKCSICSNIMRVIQAPFFHLIWPTQLLFCWFNFVFGMIIVDFSKDRGLDCNHGAHLIAIWAFGQFTGRTILGSFVDLKLISYKLFTVICFTSISLSTWILNNIRPNNHQYQDLLISLIVFILSMFISNLYILFNGLILNYMEKSLTPLSLGISSFTSSFFLLPRANVIGYYRDTIGNYDSMLTLFTYISLVAAIVWLLVPELFEHLKERKYQPKSCRNKNNYNHYIYMWFKSYSISSTVFSNVYKLPHSNNLSQNQSFFSSQEEENEKEMEMEMEKKDF